MNKYLLIIATALITCTVGLQTKPIQTTPKKQIANPAKITSRTAKKATETASKIIPGKISERRAAQLMCPYCFGTKKQQKLAKKCTCKRGCPCAEKGCRCCNEGCKCCTTPAEVIMTVAVGESFDLQMPRKKGHTWKMIKKNIGRHIEVSPEPRNMITTPEGEMMVWEMTAKKAGKPLFIMQLKEDKTGKTVEGKEYIIEIK